MLNIGRSYDRIIFNMESSIAGKNVFILGRSPECLPSYNGTRYYDAPNDTIQGGGHKCMVRFIFDNYIAAQM